jgi:hypothetical protein
MSVRLPALMLALALLAGCAGSSDQTPNPNPACDKKWITILSLGRCLLGIQPPPEPQPRGRPTNWAPAPESKPTATPGAPAPGAPEAAPPSNPADNATGMGTTPAP